MLGLSRCAGIFGAFLLAVLSIGAASAQALQEVTIGLGSGSFVAGSGRIAHELGLFKKHGLDAKLVVMDSGSVSLAGLLGGSYPMAVTNFSDVLTARSRGQDVIGVAPIYTGLGVSLVLAKGVAEKLGLDEKAPLEKRLKALQGLVIGTTGPATVATVSLKAGGESVGVNIRFAYMTYPAMLPALQTGTIQGYIAGAPFWALGIANGSAVDWINLKKEFPAEFVPTMSAALVTRGDIKKSDPELVKKVLAAYADLATAVKERPADVKAAIAKYYPTLSPEIIDILYDVECSSWRSDPITEDQVKKEIAYLKKAELAPPDIDKVNPASVPFF